MPAEVDTASSVLGRIFPFTSLNIKADSDKWGKKIYAVQYPENVRKTPVELLNALIKTHGNATSLATALSSIAGDDSAGVKALVLATEEQSKEYFSAKARLDTWLIKYKKLEDARQRKRCVLKLKAAESLVTKWKRALAKYE